MGKCNNCKRKILYNKYKMYRGKVLCPECYGTRLVRKAEERAERNRQAELVKIVTPSRRAKKASKKKGVTFNPSIYDGHLEDIGLSENNDTEDSS